MNNRSSADQEDDTRYGNLHSPAIVSAIRDEWNLLVLCRESPRRAKRKAAEPANTAPAAPRIQHRHRALRSTDTKHVCRISADRARRAIRQIDHQQQHAVPALKRPGRQQAPEQWMCLRDHPHVARQHRTQLLQSVAFTPGTGKTHLAIGMAIRACQAGHRVLFATAAEWVARLAEAHHAGRLQQELIRLGRYPLLVVDEVGYIPFEPEAANLFFQLVSSRYERAQPDRHLQQSRSAAGAKCSATTS